MKGKMISPRAILIGTWLGLSFFALPGTASAQSGRLQDQIAQHEQMLAEARSANRQREETAELNTLGTLYRQAGKPQKALEYLNQALPIERSAGNRDGEALTLNTMGRIYTDLGEEQKALNLLNQALPISRALGSRSGEATALNNLGRVYNDLGQHEKGLDYLNQALSMWHELGSRKGEASALDNIGKAHSDMGQGAQALDYLNRALPLWREANERGGEALTLDNIARANADLGKKQKALQLYNQALTIWRQIGNRQGEASTLNDLGRLYHDLGQNQSALDYYNQALPLWREVGNRSGQALALNDIGRIYAELGQLQQALDYYNQALALWREADHRRGEALTLNNLGNAYLGMGDKTRALDTDFQSLAIWREVEDRRGQAFALNSIGKAYAAMAQPKNALPQELAALDLAKQAEDPDMEGYVESSLMMAFRGEHDPDEAIFFGDEAVNSYGKIRKNISGLNKDLQAGFTQKKSNTYRVLAELLVQANRLSEAEQVLDLLKEQELKEVVPGLANNAAFKVEQIKLNAARQKAQSDLENSEKSATALTDLSVEYSVLRAKASRTPDEDARLKALDAKIEAGNGELSDFFKKTLYPDLAQKAGSADANALLSKEKSDISRLQSTLAELGPHVMGIRLLLGDQHVYAIVVTAHARKKFELNATPDALRSKVAQVRDDLRTPSSDPKVHLAELYAMVMAPFADELSAIERAEPDKDHVPTLLWSLDGVMRYLPMAALYDGHRYMAERFNNVLFTPESYGHMTGPAGANKADMRVLAMGLSKSFGGLPALPGVLPELNSVAHDPAVPESHGPLNGILLSNEQFTYEALKTELGAGNAFPVIHIASHFVMESAGGTEPYLMLGGESTGGPDGYPLTLSKLEDSSISFHGTHLLTLSACSTGKGDAVKDGLEMDSLGMIAQQKDAEAVLATLWDVNDASTSKIISDFYSRWVSHPGEGKAEALRQAQLAFLRRPGKAPVATGERGLQSEEGPSQQAGNYSHPFYWAPFVLIGNFQ